MHDFVSVRLNFGKQSESKKGSIFCIGLKSSKDLCNLFDNAEGYDNILNIM